MFASFKTAKVDGYDTLTLIEPSAGTYRTLSDAIRALPSKDGSSVDLSLYKTGVVLAYLHDDGKPVLAKVCQESKCEGFESVALDTPIRQLMDNILDADKILMILEWFADQCPVSFIDLLYNKIDEDITPISKRATDAEKND